MAETITEQRDRILTTAQRLQEDMGSAAYALQEIGKVCLMAAPGHEREALEQVLALAAGVLPHQSQHWPALIQANGGTRPRGGLDMPGEDMVEGTWVA